MNSVLVLGLRIPLELDDADDNLRRTKEFLVARLALICWAARAPCTYSEPYLIFPDSKVICLFAGEYQSLQKRRLIDFFLSCTILQGIKFGEYRRTFPFALLVFVIGSWFLSLSFAATEQTFRFALLVFVIGRWFLSIFFAALILFFAV